MQHRKPRNHSGRKALTKAFYTLAVSLGAYSGYLGKLTIAVLALAFGLGLFCLLASLRITDTKPKILAAVLMAAGCWAIGFGMGIGLHMQLSPLLS